MNLPKFSGEITEDEAKAMDCKLIVVEWGAQACGDMVRLFWAVDKKNDIIKKSRFQSFGCGTAIASSDVMCEMCEGITVDKAMKITNLDVERHLRDNKSTPAFPPQKMHCSVMAYDVIKKAAAEYKGIDLQTIQDESIVCECAQVKLSTLKDIIRVNDLKTVEEITQYTKAGGFCKSCVKPGGHEARKYYLCDILRNTRQEMEAKKVTTSALPIFKQLPFVKKILFLEKTLDAEIRPTLLNDGGNVDINDIKETPDGTTVILEYKGACATCRYRSTNTLQMIKNKLCEATGQNIFVTLVESSCEPCVPLETQNENEQSVPLFKVDPKNNIMLNLEDDL